VFVYNLLHNKPITVYKGHTRSSTYIYDAVKTLANICDNFVAGETYNIASNERHTIERLAELILEYTGADRQLVTYKEEHEILTTKHKKVDNTKSVEQLNHIASTSLEDGVRNTVEWMKKYYDI
jgi:dTDP-glucose 4,6-dehydratase